MEDFIEEYGNTIIAAIACALIIGVCCVQLTGLKTDKGIVCQLVNFFQASLY